MTKGAVKKNALSDLFISDTAEVEGGFKNASYKFVKTLLTDMAKKRALDEVFDRNINRRNLSRSFMDALASRVLVSSRFTSSVAQFNKTRMDKTFEKWCLPAKPKEFPSKEVGNS